MTESRSAPEVPKDLENIRRLAHGVYWMQGLRRIPVAVWIGGGIFFWLPLLAIPLGLIAWAAAGAFLFMWCDRRIAAWYERRFGRVERPVPSPPDPPAKPHNIMPLILGFGFWIVAGWLIRRGVPLFLPFGIAFSVMLLSIEWKTSRRVPVVPTLAAVLIFPLAFPDYDDPNVPFRIAGVLWAGAWIVQGLLDHHAFGRAFARVPEESLLDSTEAVKGGNDD